MRGFKDVKREAGSVLGDRYYSTIQTQQIKQKNKKTKDATARFKAPAYNIGERRKDGRSGQSSSNT